MRLEQEAGALRAQAFAAPAAALAEVEVRPVVLAIMPRIPACWTQCWLSTYGQFAVPRLVLATFLIAEAHLRQALSQRRHAGHGRPPGGR